MAFDMGKTRKVSTRFSPSQAQIGAPPTPTAAQTASAQRYLTSEKRKRDMAAVAARAGQRPRKMGRMKTKTFSPPGSTLPGSAVGGGGNGAVTPAGNGEWYENKWLWIAALGAALVLSQRRKRR